MLRISLGPNLPVITGSTLEIDIPPEIGIQSSKIPSTSYTQGVQDSLTTVTFRQPNTAVFKGLFNSTT